MDCNLPGSSVHGNSPRKNTGVGYHALLKGIFPTQGSNSGLPGTEPSSLALQTDSLPSEPPGRDQTQAPAVKALSPNHQIARKFPGIHFFLSLKLKYLPF